MTAAVTNLTYVDASGWIALVNERDSLHNQATQIYQNRLEQRHRLLTSSVVLLEMGNWLSPVPLRRLAIDLLDRIERSALIEVVHLTPELHARGWDLYRRRSDKDWGVIDCISFVIMLEHQITEALTGDHHFQQAGFTILL
jgi:predicted nucleic acid-binding protein